MNSSKLTKRIFNIYDNSRGKCMAGNVWCVEYVCPTLNTVPDSIYILQLINL